MRDDHRVSRILRPSLALVALAAALVLLGLAIAGPAPAATAAAAPEATAAPEAGATPVTETASPDGTAAIILQRGSEVRFGDDVLVPEGTSVPSVVAFGGDVVVDGQVNDSVVAFGGQVTINGSVGTSTVVFGGDVRLGPNAVLGRDLRASEAGLVMFGGHLTQAPGAQVYGNVESFDGFNWDEVPGWLGRALIFHPFAGFSPFGWLAQTAFFLVLALVAAALMPHQLRSVQQHLAQKPWAALGWGALAFFVAVPAILVVLVISVIGLLLVVPYGVFVVLAYFFVTTGVAAFLAQKVITGFGGKENLMLAVTVGVVGTTLVSRIPVVGSVLVLAMMVLGTGAAVLGVAEWRRRRREEQAAAAAAAAAPVQTGPQPAVITPIVQTSPGAAGPAVVATPAFPAQPPQPPETTVTGSAVGITAATQPPETSPSDPAVVTGVTTAGGAADVAAVAPEQPAPPEQPVPPEEPAPPAGAEAPEPAAPGPGPAEPGTNEGGEPQGPAAT